MGRFRLRWCGSIDRLPANVETRYQYGSIAHDGKLSIENRAGKWLQEWYFKKDYPNRFVGWAPLHNPSFA